MKEQFQKSKMRLELDKAHLEIIKSRQYRGARESDVVQWLADHVENNYVPMDIVKELVEAGSEAMTFMDDCKDGHYECDSFSSQPLRVAIKKFEQWQKGRGDK